MAADPDNVELKCPSPSSSPARRTSPTSPRPPEEVHRRGARRRAAAGAARHLLRGAQPGRRGARPVRVGGQAARPRRRTGIAARNRIAVLELKGGDPAAARESLRRHPARLGRRTPRAHRARASSTLRRAAEDIVADLTRRPAQGAGQPGGAEPAGRRARAGGRPGSLPRMPGARAAGDAGRPDGTEPADGRAGRRRTAGDARSPPPSSWPAVRGARLPTTTWPRCCSTSAAMPPATSARWRSPRRSRPAAIRNSSTRSAGPATGPATRPTP